MNYVVERGSKARRPSRLPLQGFYCHFFVELFNLESMPASNLEAGRKEGNEQKWKQAICEHQL